MAHNVETMAYAGQVPWHGLGKRVSSDLAPAEMLTEAGLDWTVDKLPLFFELNGSNVNSGSFALVRNTDSRVLTVISETWNPVQNHEAFDFFNSFVSAGEMEMHTAGSLRSGEIVWALAKVNESFELPGHDRVDSYLLFSNPHRFGQSINIRFTPIRVVCNNTLSQSLSLRADLSLKLSHRKTFNAEDVKATLLTAHTQMEKYKEAAEFLTTKRYDDESLKMYFDRVFPVLTTKEKSRKVLSKSAEVALEVINTQPGAEMSEGSWWSAFNTTTYMIDHVIGKSTDTRLQSAWYGQNARRKEKALDLAIYMAEGS